MLGRLGPNNDNPQNDPCPHCGSKWGADEVLVYDKNGNERLKLNCRECERFIKWKALPITLERAQRYIIEFGKHSGKTLKTIEESHPSYIEWLSVECSNSTLKNLAKEIIAKRPVQTHRDE